ncbi:hypothetical protein ACHHYP_05598 [Achlya hypogyna]|uniref:Transmembrane protein n=1 Tax=Achlya hypogyna TaxID=1202772 RepID=A0A1V9YWZ4_ACHHY|nr:hypothetical protein ACHHYP_05598 [Achlya hypogyna]
MEPATSAGENHEFIDAGGPWKRVPVYGRGVLTANESTERSNGNLVVPGYTVADVYGILLCMPIAPLGLVLYALLMVYLLPIFVLIRLYIACLAVPSRRLERHAGFQLFSMVVFLLSLPVLLLVTVYLCATLLGIVLPGSLLYGVLSCNLFRLSANLAPLKDARKVGHWSWNDVLVVVLGEVNRQGALKLAFHFPCVCVVVPVLKYVFVVNPFFFPLQEKFTNQWTEAIPFNDATIVSSLIKSVSWSVEDKSTRDEIRNDYFSANYPLPSAKDDVVVGLQVMSIVNFTNSIHNVMNENTRSPTAKRGIYRVPLYLYNPFHIMTGYVEVNLQFGSSLEHPSACFLVEVAVWCVTGTNHIGNQLYKNANVLFWQYAPQITNDLKMDPLNA